MQPNRQRNRGTPPPRIVARWITRDFYLVMKLAKQRLPSERGTQGDVYWWRIPADERPPKVEGYEWTALVEEYHMSRVYIDELGHFSGTEARLLAEYLVSDFPDLAMEVDRTSCFQNEVFLTVHLPMVTHVLRKSNARESVNECHNEIESK